MRVKEKPYPLEIAAVVSPNKRNIQPTKIATNLEPNLEISNFSNSNDTTIDGYSGTTEPDAIHRRLHSAEGDFQNLARSVVDLMEGSSAPLKRKRSSAKIITPTKERKEVDAEEAVSNTVVEQSDNIDNSTITKQEPTIADTQSHELQKESPIDSAAKAINRTSVGPTSKGKKKLHGKKPFKKKKTVNKKSFNNDGDDFEIDPRLGGSKIKQNLNSKGKEKKQKLTDQELKKVKVLEQRFPFIRVEGSWNQPNAVKIVNGHAKEDENEGKTGASKLTKAAQYIDEEHRNKAAKVGFTSTLSERYDTHNRDASWVCVFCQHYTHMQCLGDLYGPYYVNQVPPEDIWFSKKNPDTRDGIHSELSSPNRLISKKSKKSPKNKKLCTKNEHDLVCAVPLAVASTPMVAATQISADIIPLSPSIGEKKEVWFHESCLIWAPGVCLVPPRLIGLDEAVSDSQQVVCEYCRKSGGHIFCRNRGCGLRSHFPCAVASGWVLQEDNFIALCPEHQKLTSST